MRVVTFGEIMLRLTPPGQRRIVQTDVLEATPGGAEANVAAALARLGLEATFVSRVPEHEVGQWIVDRLREADVDTRWVVRGGERLGIYFHERGAGVRDGKVIYDRARSAFTTLGDNDIDWDEVLRGASWLHLSGITLALGEGPRRLAAAACRAAARAGVTVSLDLNYRPKLWGGPEEAARVMEPFVREHVDVCLGGRGDPSSCLGIATPEEGPIEAGFGAICEELCRRFDLRAAVLTLRDADLGAASSSSTVLGAVGFDAASQRRCSASPRRTDIVDRLGAGDAFCAGYIYSTLNGKSLDDSLDFALALSLLSHTTHGDFSVASVPEVEFLARGGVPGRVSR